MSIQILELFKGTSHKHINLDRSGLNKTEQGIIPKGLTNLIFNIIDNVL